MNAKDLGSVRMQPQKNDEGTLIYYQTDKGFGVHIDATSGKLLQVRHMATDATVSVDGVEAYEDAVESVEDKRITAKQALQRSRKVCVTYGNDFGGVYRVNGYVTEINQAFDGGDAHTEITLDVGLWGFPKTIAAERVSSIVEI